MGAEDINVPTIDNISTEINFVGNLVGSHSDLCELMVLAAKGSVTLHTAKYGLDDFRSAMDDLNAGNTRGLHSHLLVSYLQQQRAISSRSNESIRVRLEGIHPLRKSARQGRCEDESCPFGTGVTGVVTFVLACEVDPRRGCGAGAVGKPAG